MRLYTKLLHYFLRDLYAKQESSAGMIQALRQENQQQQEQIESLHLALCQAQEELQESVRQTGSAQDERAERTEKRLDCLEHYRTETEKRMKSDDETTIGLAHRTECIETALRECHIYENPLQLFNKKTYSQAGEDAILLYACAMMGIPLNQCSYLDLGANKPVEMSNTYFFYEQGARGVLVEANPLLIPDLQNQRSGDIILNQAVTDQSGESVLFHVLNLDGLSRIGDVSALLEQNPSAKLEKSIEIRTICYNDIIRNYFHGNAPVILNLDIEGLEMQILQSMDLEHYRPLFIILEMIPYSEKLSAGIKDPALLAYLESRNYIEYAFTGINSVFIDAEQYQNYLS